MIMGSVELFQNPIAGLVSMSGVPFAAVEYRLAPEHPHPTLVEDCYAGLTWLRDNAKELSVDPSRIGIMGESAGGGIAAGVTLMARDRTFTPPLAKSILIYPMMDDRNTILDEKLAPFVFWSYDGFRRSCFDLPQSPDPQFSAPSFPGMIKSVHCPVPPF
jgi:acetyl esterase/lipase